MVEEKGRYVEEIVNLLKTKDTPEKINKVTKLLTAYYIFCRRNNINSFDYKIWKLYDASYIIPSTPKIEKVDIEKTKIAADNLKYAIENNKGITQDEADILLNFSIQKAREKLEESYNKEQNNKISIKDVSLGGSCGYGQALTLTPFINIGCEFTINNVSNMPNSKYRHAFGTVTLPIEENGKVKKKRYLLDSTYRQFFSTLVATEAEFFKDTDEDFNADSSPAAGYFIIHFRGGLEVAEKILRDGYIELTDDVLRLYGTAFGLEGIGKKNFKEEAKKIYSTPIKDYYYSLDNSLDKLDYDNDEIDLISQTNNFPSNKAKLNKF